MQEDASKKKEVMYKTKDAAKYLKVTRQTLWKLAKNGGITAPTRDKVDTRLRLFAQSELDALKANIGSLEN